MKGVFQRFGEWLGFHSNIPIDMYKGDSNFFF